jgi:integrase
MPSFKNYKKVCHLSPDECELISKSAIFWLNFPWLISLGLVSITDWWISLSSVPAMLDKKILLSIVFMRAVLGGRTFQDVGRDHGLTGGAVSCRVKRLALRLCTNDLLAGINPKALNFVNKLREHGEQIETALCRFESNGFPLQKPSPKLMLSPREIAVVLHCACLRSSAPLRDVALVHVALTTGAKPIEVARLRISDYLNRDGTVCDASRMRADIAYNHRERPLFFRNSDTVSAIDAYLAQGRESQETGHMAYRGFSPGEFLFLNDAGKPFKVVCRQGVEGNKYSSQELVDTYSKILARSGMRGMRLQVFRRTLARKMLERGASEEQIGIILGIADGKNVRKLLPPRPSLGELMKDIFSASADSP